MWKPHISMQNFILHNKKVLLAVTHSCCCDHMWSWCQSISPLCVYHAQHDAHIPGLQQIWFMKSCFCYPTKVVSNCSCYKGESAPQLSSVKILTVNCHIYIFIYIAVFSPLLNQWGHWPLLLNYHWGSRFSWVNLFKTWTCINYNLWNILELDKVVSHLIMIWINCGTTGSCIIPISFCGC